MSEEKRDRNSASGLLAEVMAKLDEVMAEAERLRQQVSQQLAEERASQQQRVTPSSRRKKKVSRKKKA